MSFGYPKGARPVTKRLLLSVLATGLVLSTGALGTTVADASVHQVRSGSRPVCAKATPHHAACASLIVLNQLGKPFSPTAGPTGFNPADLQDAYKLPSSTNGSGQTVAIIDAFDDPNAEADLQVYRNQFGLSTCTTANGCFKKVNQTGGSTPPPPNAGWAEEISLDVDMVSAICPNCHILLVEASSNSFSNLYTAEKEAVTLGAKEASNSWLGGEYSGENTDSNTYFDHPGVAITAASGDGGFGTGMPAASQYVTAVGGTTLVKKPTKPRGWKETVWPGAGSGCSQFIPKPAWQHDNGCTRRTVADVSAVADPNTGVSVYDSTSCQGRSGWLVFGGTSVASPSLSGIVNSAGSNTSSTAELSLLYQSVSNNGLMINNVNFRDIVSGTAGSFSAIPGWDFVTGIGSTITLSGK
jgi:subtilase family serine protease